MSRAASVDPHWRDYLTRSGIADLRGLLDASPATARWPGEWEPLHKAGLGGRERWRCRLDNSAPNGVVYLKRYCRMSLRQQWDRMLRQSASRSSAHWEYERLRELHSAGIPAPRPIGFAEEMRSWFERRSTVLLESVRGGPLDAYWKSAIASRAGVTRSPVRQDFMRRVGRFVAAFHGTGLCHRDLYLCHIFVETDERDGTPPRFSIIDLARVHRPRIARMRWIIKDLSQFEFSARHSGFSRADRLRMLAAYLGLDPRQPRVRWYARRIVAKANAIERRERRKGRLEPGAP